MYWRKDTYRIEISEEAFQLKLEELVTVREKNSFKNHIFESKIGDDNTIRGEFSKNEFTIWRTNRRWSVFIYPIFIGKRQTINSTSILEIRTRFNLVAEFSIITLSTTYLIYAIKRAIPQFESGYEFTFISTLISIILFCCIQVIPLLSYYNLKIQTLKNLQEYFGLTKVKLKKR